MPYSDQMADLMRADLGFLLAGHMDSGVHEGGAMFRPGKPRMAEAQANAASMPPKKKKA